MTRRGKFIVLDGMDGSGKGTQLAMLKHSLAGLPVVFTREPGGTPHAEEIRKILLDPATEHTPLRDLELFWEARRSIVSEVIVPAIEGGKHVITDRYDSSSWAFQVCAEEQRDALAKLFWQKRAKISYPPDAYIIFDLPARVAYERRAKDVSQEKSRFDVKPIEYHQRVRDGFREFARLVPHVHLVNADRPPEQVYEDVWNIVSGVIGGE